MENDGMPRGILLQRSVFPNMPYRAKNEKNKKIKEMKTTKNQKKILKIALGPLAPISPRGLGPISNFIQIKAWPSQPKLPCLGGLNQKNEKPGVTGL